VTEDTAPAGRCEICGEDGAAELLQDCFHCGRRYHLNPYNNQPGKDCGDAVIGASLGVHYLCDVCLEELSEEATTGETARAASTAPHAPTPPPAAPRDPGATPRRRYRRQEPS
jgi:predicted  nucleic acid-binding Zn-ribbon protein